MYPPVTRKQAEKPIMKSNACAGFLTMLLIVVYPLVNGIQTEASRDMARFIPENALVYFEQYNGSIALREFTRSPLGKVIDTIDFQNTGKKIGLTETFLAELREVLSFYTAIKDNNLVHEILGKRFAVAIFPPVDLNRHFAVKDYIKENTVVVARPKHSAEGLVFLGATYSNYNEMYPVSSVLYGKHSIKRFQVKSQTISLVIIEGFFVMSRNEKHLRRCIDTYDGELPALTKNADFTKIRKILEIPDRFFYFPVNDLRQFVEKTVTGLTFPGKELVLKELATTVGFANFGYGSWTKKNSVIDKILVQYHSDEVNSVVKNHIDAAPVRCSMLSLTTEDPMVFYWSNVLEINHFQPYLNNSRATEPQLEKFLSTVEHITGKNAEEIISLLGKEVSLIVEPGPKDRFFSFPLGLLFLRVNNVPELRTVLEQIIEEYNIAVSMKSYGPLRYWYWTPSPQDGLQPLYGFLGDLFFFGNSSSLLQRIVDRQAADFSLMDNEAIKTLDPGFSENNNSVTYLNNIALIEVLQKWLGLVGMTLAIEDREFAYKVHTTLEEIINPLLDGLSMYEKSCTRSYFTPEMVIIESITKKTTGSVKKRMN
jgi:hypothetical protein